MSHLACEKDVGMYDIVLVITRPGGMLLIYKHEPPDWA